MFWECSFPPFVHVRESVEFRDLLLRDGSLWPRCLLWHGWFLALACAGGAWATFGEDIACAGLERLLGSHSEENCKDWVPPDRFVENVVSSNVSDHPDVWTDGSFVLDELSVVVVSALSGLVLVGLVAGGSIRRKCFLMAILVWSAVSCLTRFVVLLNQFSVLRFVESSLPCSPSLLNIWEVDNLNVVRHVSRILDGHAGRKPFTLTIDGDLLAVIERMILQKGC